MRFRTVAALTVGLTVAATAGPALAGSNPSGTTVSMSTPTVGSRVLDVLDLAGNALTSLPLKPNVPAPFRVRVSDAGINDLTTGFTVSAVMNNLYKKSGASYDWSTKIPSSAVSLNYNPITALGVSFDDLPLAQLAGTIPTCTTLVTNSILNAADITGTGAAVPLCSLLSTTGVTISPSDAVNVVTSLLTTVTPLLNNVLNLPFELSGNESGAFTNADYSGGTIGASDTGKPGSPPAATPRQMLQGVPGMTATLLNEIKSAIASTAGLVPTSVTGSGAYTKLSDALNALSTSSNAALQTLASDLSPLTQSQQVAIINQLTASLLDPTLSTLSNVMGAYNAFPLMTVAPGSVPAGTYEGTMTVTMVQP